MDQDDQEEGGYRWETEYEKTWEAIQENEDGLLQPNVEKLDNQRRRKRLFERKNLRLGMMRYLYIVIDMSQSMNNPDLKPTRIGCTLKLIEMFLNEFIEQNPISQIGLVVTRDKRSERVSDMSAQIGTHLEALKKISDMSCIGEPSLQNSLELVAQSLKNMPNHTSKEVLILMGSLTTCDPSDIYQTIDSLAAANIRCSVIGLAAEVRVCRALANKTKGSYDVILHDEHYKESLFQHLNPPPTTASTETNLIKMGFPQFLDMGEHHASYCVCHPHQVSTFTSSGYFCPQCNSKYCDLPVECEVCGLTLVSPAHLARSYHHLFPVELFAEYNPDENHKVYCFSCNEEIRINRSHGTQCKLCTNVFCVDCDLFIHETLHFCPGCSPTT